MEYNCEQNNDKPQTKLTELLNCQFIIGKFGSENFENNAMNYCMRNDNCMLNDSIFCTTQMIPNEKRDIDYDSFFNNKKYVYKNFAIMSNIYHHCDFTKDIDSEFIEEIKTRFPIMFQKESKIEKFWYDIKLNTIYSLDFYNRYKNELGLEGIFRIHDITFDYIIENKSLFDSYQNFKQIIGRQQPKKIILEFSDLYKKYFPQYKENNEYELIFNFFKEQMLDLDFINLLISEHGWKNIYQWFLDHLGAYVLAAHYYGVYPLDENPDWDYILSKIPNKDDETYTIDLLKKIMLNAKT